MDPGLSLRLCVQGWQDLDLLTDMVQQGLHGFRLLIYENFNCGCIWWILYSFQ